MISSDLKDDACRTLQVRVDRSMDIDRGCVKVFVNINFFFFIIIFFC